MFQRRPRRGDGKIVVISGAASGIGRATAKRFHSLGWRVIALDVDGTGLERLVQETGSNLIPLTMDVRDVAACEYLPDVLAEHALRPGVCDALINVAGVDQSLPVLEASEEEMRFLLEVNMMGMFRLCRVLLPWLIEGEMGGTIVNISSIAGLTAWPWHGFYSTSKFAIEGFSDAVRREALAARLPLRIVVVEPGVTDTKLVANVPETQKRWAREHRESSPFAVACEEGADFQLRLRKYGLGTDHWLLAVTPERIAEAIEKVVTSSRPCARVMIATPVMRLVVALCSMLPTRLADRLAARM